MNRKTIALIGEPGEFCPALTTAAAQNDLRLLFISHSKEQGEALKAIFNTPVAAEVEFLTCEKEGCWEADIIVFSCPSQIEPALLKKVREVATQKIVVLSSKNPLGNRNEEILNFEELLPNSKILYLTLKEQEFQISGSCKTAIHSLSKFLENAGYRQAI